MYVHPAFKTEDAEALAFARERGFGAVVAVDAGQPVAAHVPFLMLERDGGLHLEAHVARPNPLHGVIAQSPRVLVIVSGADAYISPDWYASADQVPTWNYQAVHLSGTARVLAAERTLDHVEAISLDREERLRPKTPWSTTKMTAAKREMMLRGIVAIEIRVDKVEAAFKLSQNRAPADRHEAARMLAWRGGPNERVIAKAMQPRMRLGK